MSTFHLDICIVPASLDHLQAKSPLTLVVVDILRATTSMCAALDNGAGSIIPVSLVEEAEEYKKNGYSLAGEQDGKKLRFADIGNSPYDFIGSNLKGVNLAYRTTNGTGAIIKASEHGRVVLGAFANISALESYIRHIETDLAIVCSGWNGLISAEDLYFAGILAKKLMEYKKFRTDSDEVFIALEMASREPEEIIGSCSHARRLFELRLEKDVAYCFQHDTHPVIAGFRGGRIRKI